MDISTLLPLMMKGNKDSELIGTLLSASQGGDKSQLLSKLSGGKNGNLDGLLNLYKDKRRGYGFSPIVNIASSEILGIMVKLYG